MIQLMLHKTEQTVDSRASLHPPSRRAARQHRLGGLPLSHPINLSPARLGIGLSLEPSLVLIGCRPLNLPPRHAMFSGENHQPSHQQP